MKYILSTLSKYKFRILVVIILLIIQAMCDLALPTYTSKIVNIGIQQGGIESVVPKVIRSSELNNIKKYLTNEEVNKVNSEYEYIEKGSKEYINKYPIVKSESVYILKEDGLDLESILMYPIIVYSTNEESELSGVELVQKMKDTYKGNENLIEQMGISYVRNEYESIGIDLNDLQMKYIYKTGFYMICVALTAMGITFVSVYMSSKISAFFAKDLRSKLVNKVMSFENEEMGKIGISSLITRCTNDIEQIQMLVMVFLRIVIFAPIIAFGAIMKVSGSSMGWVIALAVLAILSLMFILFVLVVPRFKLFQELLDKLTTVSREILTGLPVIRAFANHKHEEERFNKANNDITKNGLFINRAMAIMSPTLTILMNSISILIIWVGAGKIDVGSMQVGSLIALITYTMQIVTAFLMVSMVLIMLPRAMVSIKRVKEVFDTQVKVKNNIKLKKFKEVNEHSVEFKDVYFRYPFATEDVLHNINFKITSGKTIAFIGSTGSGKSTLVNLIPRFYDATSGKILIDGVNIKDVSIKDLRDRIGYVPQKGMLFSGTILSNIALGLKSEDKKVIENASKISQAEEFILSNEKGYEREISEGGTNVSGGQRQRLSIARAIAKDPVIYIFDDAMSALDYKTDALLRKELSKVTKDKIVFIVGQRIASVMHADVIVVLDEGKIVGMGTHNELLESCPIYKEIKISQLGE